MRKKSDITPEDFSDLLAYLSPNVDEAAKQYEEIRQGLSHYFYYRGCIDPDALADETINRVTLKLPAERRGGDFVAANYFYAFAAKIYLEDLRRRKRLVPENDEALESLIAEDSRPDEGNSRRFVCMERCILEQSPDEKRLLVKYYGFGKGERSEERKKLAAQLNINVEILHTRVSRLRKWLRDCLRKCLDEEKT